MKLNLRSLQSKFMLLAAPALILAACGGGGEPPPSSFPGLTVTNGVGYLASNLHVHRFDPTTGQEAWRFPPIGEQQGLRGPFAGEPAVLTNLVVVGGTIAGSGIADAHVYGLDAATGRELWRWSVPGQTEAERREFAAGISTDGKLLFAPNGNGTLYALDPAKLEGGAPTLVWSFKTGNKLWGRPAVANGVVYQPSLDHSLYALDAATGRQLWVFTAGASIASNPVLADGVLYFGAFDSKVYAIDAETGSKRWESPVNAWIWNEALVADGVVYLGDVKGGLYALNTTDGARRWVANPGGSIHAKPTIHNGQVYVVSTDQFVYQIPVNATPDANGVVAATRFNENSLPRRLVSAPVVLDGQMLLPYFDGDVKVAAFNLDSRSQVFQVTLPTATPKP
jgi:outer membrane protein assembly factor BamB